MTDPSPALIDTVAAAIADSDEYHGYWDHLTDTIGNPSPGTDTRPLEACRAMYRREARAALAALLQPCGYAVLARDEDPYGLNRRRVITCPDRRSAERVAARRAEAGWDATVVALVPVEDQ